MKKERLVKKREEGHSIWKSYHVELQVVNELAAGIPKTDKEIMGMLERRMPGEKPVGATPLGDLAAQVAVEVGIAGEEEEEKMPGYATFKRDEHGLYFEGRAVRGHLNLLGVR